MTSDFIDRQAVLKAINNMVKECDSVYVTSALRNLEVIVADLPPAQPETHEERTETHACDLIDRQTAIDALDVGAELLRRVLDDANIVGAERAKYEWGLGLIESYISDMKELPSAQPDMSGYSDKLWQKAYERGKAEAQRKRGKWLPDNNSLYEMRFVCSECHESEVVPTIGFTKYKPIWDFCPNCGAEMREPEDIPMEYFESGGR